MDLVGDGVEVHRDPAADGYRSARKVGRADALTIAALPGIELRAGDVPGTR